MAQVEGRLARMYQRVYGKAIDHGLDLPGTVKPGTLRYYGRKGVDVRFSDDGPEVVPVVGWSATPPALTQGPAMAEALDFEPKSVELAEYRTSEEGWGGTDYDESGRKARALGDHPVKDVPVKWRGLYRDHGEAQRLYKSSTVYQRAVNEHIAGLRSAPWGGKVPDTCPEELRDAVQEQADIITEVIHGLEGGWKKFINEAVRSVLVQGFGLWQRIHYEDGRLRKLAFRETWTLDGLALNEDETEILAFRFVDSEGVPYVIDARDMLVISFQASGLDIEGLSPWRAGCEYERATQMLIELFMVSAEKHGTPQDVAEQEVGADMNDADKQTVTQALDYKRADNVYSLVMPPGVSLKTLSPSGSMPDFMAMIRYCDEQKLLPLSAEGALFTGQSSHGSHAMLDAKDEQASTSIVSIGELIADALNGGDNLAWTGPLKTMIDAMGGPVAPGCYPVLGFVEQNEEASLDDLAQAAGAGLIRLDNEVIAEMHKRLKLPPPKEVEDAAEDMSGEEADESPTFEVVASDCGHEHSPHAVRAEVTRGVDYILPDGPVSIATDPKAFIFADNAFTREIDPEEAVQEHTNTNQRIGKLFAGIAKRMREDWVERSAGLDALALIALRETMRNKWLEQFRLAAQPEVDSLRAKGGLGVAKELGLIEKVPKRIPNAETTSTTAQVADALALKSYNITESYLLQRSQLEANGMPESTFPEIPDADIYEKHARSQTAPAYVNGRNDFVESVKQAGERIGEGGEDLRIVAEYSSVLEESTCQPCADLDGRRFYVGSKAYEKFKPVSVCEGGNRCRCIMTYLADEQDLEQIKAELDAGFSQAGNDVRFSESVPGALWLWCHAYKTGEK